MVREAISDNLLRLAQEPKITWVKQQEHLDGFYRAKRKIVAMKTWKYRSRSIK